MTKLNGSPEIEADTKLSIHLSIQNDSSHDHERGLFPERASRAFRGECFVWMAHCHVIYTLILVVENLTGDIYAGLRRDSDLGDLMISVLDIIF